MNRRQRRAQEATERSRRAIEIRKAERTVRLTVLQRSCGECTACCTVMGVEELAKPPGTPCVHLGEGCTIYGARPKDCAEFHCVWRMGLGGVLDRPDMSGILFDVARSELGALIAREAIEGAFEFNKGLLDHLTNQGHLIYLVKDEQERGVIGPPEKLALVANAVLQKVSP